MEWCATIGPNELRAAPPPEGASVLILGLHLHVLHHVEGPALDYVGVAIASFLGWVGLPGPGEAVLIAAAVFASKHKLDITPVVLVAFVAATVGGIVGWLIGLYGGRSVLTAPGALHTARLRAAARGEELFKRMEVVAILLTPAWVAGINRSRTGVYMVTNAASAIVWAVVLGVGAYYAGPPVLDVFSDVGAIATLAFLVVLAGLVGVEMVRRRRRRGTLGEQTPPPGGELSADR
jgi:membrane protein DedA with SNARE-associated domain